MFNDLKNRWNGPGALSRADVLVGKLRKEAEDLSGGKKLKAGGPTLALRNSIDNLPWKPWFEDRMDADTAQLAVYAYGDRNKVCHAGISQLREEKRWQHLADRMSNNLEELPQILPDDQLRYLTEWRRILRYYRDRGIRLNREGC